MKRQLDLLDLSSAFPDGFKYAPEVLSPELEEEVVRHVRRLAFENFQFHGFVGKRRVVSYGWKYDFNEGCFKERTTSRPFCSCFARSRSHSPRRLPRSCS
jgi:hypothetical protein